MGALIMVCGPSGSGKTTYAYRLCEERNAVRFSIDQWMQTLFSKDMTSLDYDWMVERLLRCHQQIRQLSEQILHNGGTVVLDLGFTDLKTREDFYAWAAGIHTDVELHFLNLPVKIREERVKQRNANKDPDLYSFEVTPFMFNFMEKRFERPTEDELPHGQFFEITG